MLLVLTRNAPVKRFASKPVVSVCHRMNSYLLNGMSSVRNHLRSVLKKIPFARRLVAPVHKRLPIWNPLDPPGKDYNGQYAQDRWVVERVFSGRMAPGYFVELGAGDGLYLSNTLVLERHFGWAGLLIEPTSAFFQLKDNRQATCVRACVSSSSRPRWMAERSCPAHTIQQAHNTLLSVVLEGNTYEEAVECARGFVASGAGSRSEVGTPNIFSVRTATLASILREVNAPTTIDYLSLDVEGHEHEVLKEFPFEAFKFLCMTVERPIRPLHALLRRNGYVAVLADAAGDVFYVNREIYKEYARR